MVIIYFFYGLLAGAWNALISFPITLYIFALVLCLFKGGYKVLFAMGSLRKVITVSVWLSAIMGVLALIVSVAQRDAMVGAGALGWLLSSGALVRWWPMMAERLGLRS